MNDVMNLHNIGRHPTTFISSGAILAAIKISCLKPGISRHRLYTLSVTKYRSDHSGVGGEDIYNSNS
jgi:hypothetical protein